MTIPPNRSRRETRLIALIGRNKVPLSNIVRDMLFLLDATGTLEHAQDHARLAEVRARYGWKLEDREAVATDGEPGTGPNAGRGGIATASGSGSRATGGRGGNGA